MLTLILVILLVALVIATSFTLFFNKDDGGDIQKSRATGYWKIIDSVLETDDWTHHELVKWAINEVYLAKKETALKLLEKLDESKDIKAFRRELVSQLELLDTHHNLYLKKEGAKNVKD